MKKLIFVLLLTGVWLQGSSQKKKEILITLGTEMIPVEDFLKTFQRNNQNISDPAEKKSPEEYIDLYINFKLKVLEAQSLGIDTTRAFREELAGYRAELAAPYLTDISYTAEWVRETYRRMTLEVNAAHILIGFPQNPSPSDTLEAFNRILEIKDEIESGLDFNLAARRYSQDPTVADNMGNLGWFSVFQMVVPFEDAAYTTPPGSISAPVRTRFGYHLVKVHETRDAGGEMKVAHIMKMFSPEMTPARKNEARQLIDSLYLALQNGADFGRLAREFSDDQRSAIQGGELPFFNRSRMISEFSDPAFSLENDGDITGPVETRFGYHIIKRLEFRSIPEFEQVKAELEERIRRDPDRSVQNQGKFVEKLKQQYGYQRYPELAARAMSGVEHRPEGSTEVIPGTLSGNEILFTLGNKEFTAGDWLEHQRTAPDHHPALVNMSPEEQYAHWENSAILQYEDSRLEEKHPAFRSLMQEYHDGLLLFAISEKKIWQRASEDTTGLKSFYETNKGNYMWGERFRGMILVCPDAEMKELAEDKLDEGIPLAELPDILQTGFQPLKVEEGTWARGDNEVIDFYIWNGPQPPDWSTETGFVKGNIIAPEPKLLEESRGFHVSDYQEYLEKSWIHELRQKYPVRINRKLLKSLQDG